MIPLMRNAFLGEAQTRRALADFILHAPRLSMDVKCREFESTFASQEGRAAAVLFNSGGSANLAMVQALKNIGRLKDGDKVGFSAVTWSTNIMPLIQLGLRPVPVDCDRSTLNVMSTELARVISQKKLKAMFLTNVLGLCGDLPAIRALCKAKGVILFEDNCEALGTELPEGRAGSFGVMSSFSFYVAHHMSTIEGGVVCVDDPELEEMLRIVRANGWDRNLTARQQARLRKTHGIKDEFQSKYTFYDLGYNLRPSEITGFLGLEQLKHLDAAVGAREANYDRFALSLAGSEDLLSLNRSHITRLSNFAFPVLCRTPKIKRRVLARFQAAGIETRPLIAGNMVRQPFYAKYVGGPPPRLPGADFFHDNSFYFGNYPELTEEDCLAIESCLRRTA
ncbi:MAG: DegT/DnrJ/EryC1/StrS aminotransferase [Elusimicrobia bacterium RBG_16_66_12]|nr:MAG: DegT/DnrJ/EryC1/StrS aminotransferase [Elusimicrobia bacterium RBG_16_66_12]